MVAFEINNLSFKEKYVYSVFQSVLPAMIVLCIRRDISNPVEMELIAPAKAIICTR